jgi:tetratricopeptide (TPR) repeat protein
MAWKIKVLFSRKEPSVQSKAAASFQRGNDHVSRQEWRLALDCYRDATRVDPDHAEAHAYSGNVLRQLGEFDAAMAAYDRALAVKRDYSEVHYNRGTLLHQARQLQAALQSFEAALAANPAFAQAHLRRGDVLRELGQLDAAQRSYRQTIALVPDNVDALFNLGVLQSDTGSHADALKSFDAVIASVPGHAAAHAGRGIALMSLGQPQDALASFDTAIELKPDFAQAFSNRAQAQSSLGLLADARASNDQAVRLAPQDAAIHFNQGEFLSNCKDWLTAAQSYQAAIALKPDYAEAHCNLGLSYQEMGQEDLALASYARALELNPRLATVFNNRGNLLRTTGRFAEAWRDYREALALVPDMVEANYNTGQLALIEGDFDSGWRGYGWRGKTEEGRAYAARTFPQPAWDGEPALQGKRIFLYAEQGLGDTIQFCRYTNLVAALGAHVVLEVQPALVELLANIGGVSNLISAGSPVPPADYQCSLMNLPAAFKTTIETIPSDIPYLYADPQRVERYRELQGSRVRPRVGLAWSGNPSQSNDRNRSVALSRFIACLPSEFEYYSLQKEVRDPDAATLRSSLDVSIRELPLDSFLDTAALLETLDLVVSVDTSVAHLSGAMGKKTWVLLCYLPDWRWLWDRKDNPWYPSVTLYRQPAPNDWESVMSEVKSAMLAWGRTFEHHGT